MELLYFPPCLYPQFTLLYEYSYSLHIQQLNENLKIYDLTIMFEKIPLVKGLLKRYFYNLFLI